VFVPVDVFKKLSNLVSELHLVYILLQYISGDTNFNRLVMIVK
jgi:hypothetical protein